MTNWLIKKFIKEPDKAQTPQVRSAYGKLAGFVGIACNLLLVLLKGLAALASGSVAIMADAVNNLSDMSSG
ncbi:MAG: cation-efflux pump, partial [Clostridiales bacterium]|nr:cation-efflux pump [Clostridiales bacterium]